MLGNIAEIVDAVDLPVNADFQAGYADDLEGLAVNVTRCVATGVAGLSIEDARGSSRGSAVFAARGGGAGPGRALCNRGRRRRASDRAGGMLPVRTPRSAERGHHATSGIRRGWRGRAVCAGLRSREDIASLVDALRPYPVNVLMGSDTGLTVNDLAELGVRRISVGSALSRVAWGAIPFRRTAACRGGLVRGTGRGRRFRRAERVVRRLTSCAGPWLFVSLAPFGFVGTVFGPHVLEPFVPGARWEGDSSRG